LAGHSLPKNGRRNGHEDAATNCIAKETVGVLAFELHRQIACDLPRGKLRWPIVQEMTMDLHALSMWLFMLSVLIAVLAIIGTFTTIAYVSTYAFLVAIIAFVVLAFGNVVKT
jgi:hypothetical protein